MGFLTKLGLSAEGVSALFVLSFLFCLVLMGLLAVLFFIKAVALYKMALKKGIKNEWFCFVPVLNSVAIGNLADSKSSKKGFYKIILPVFSLLSFVFLAASFISLIVSFINILFAADAAVSANLPLGSLLTFPIINSAIWFFITAVCLFAKKVVLVIAEYNIFREFGVNKAVILAVLMFVFSPLEPFFLAFAAKEREI